MFSVLMKPQSRPPKVMINEINRFFLTPTHLQPKALSKQTETGKRS
jgi:hypothetical protein